MAIVVPIPISALSLAPDPADRTTFDSRAYPWAVSQGVYRTEANALAVNVYNNAVDAAASATAAAGSVTAAAGQVALSHADALATAADRIQTGLDKAAAAASAASAAAIAGSFTGTSTTSWTPVVAAGQVFTTQAGEQYTQGIFLTLVSVAAPNVYGFGQVSSYVGTTLTMDIQFASGTGAHADWNISLAGARGPAGTGITNDAVGWHATGGTTPKTLTVDEDLVVSQIPHAPIYKSANFSAASGKRYLVDTVAGAVTTVLPAAPAAGAVIVFDDARGTFGTNNLIVSRNGKSFVDLYGVVVAEDLVVDVDGLEFLIFFDGTNWRLA